jgi:hypothetical protein
MAAMPTVAAASRSSSEADREGGCEARREAGCGADSAAGSAVACGEPGVGSSAATNRMPGLPPQQLSPLIVFFLSYITSKKKL